MTKRVLMILTNGTTLGDTGRENGAYLPEVAHPLAVFRARDYAVDFASPLGGAVHLYGGSPEDPDVRALLDDAETLARIQASLAPRQIDDARYDAIFYVGGHATMWDFPDAADIAAIAARVYERGGVVSAVCHGPAGLVNIRLSTGAFLVGGQTVTSFTNEEEDAVGLRGVLPFLLESRLVERGASFSKAADFERHVVVSGRLVTGQNPASATGVAEEVVKLLDAVPA